MTSFVAALALLALEQAAPAPRLALSRPAAPPGLSWEDADTVARTIARIEQRLRSGHSASDETVVVSEHQINSFVNLTLGSSLPREVSSVALRLWKDRLGAHAVVDLDQVKRRLPAGPASAMLMFLGGTVPVEIVGRVSCAEGAGRVEIEQATVGGISFPTAALVELVSLLTRTKARPRGVDIQAPFALPWTARRVRLEPGRALVDFYAER